MLPLHHSCNNGYSLHLIQFLIQAYPESTTVQDNDGNTPWQYLTKAASRVYKRGMLLLHREAAHFKGLNVEILPILFNANPEAIGLQDNLGLLPIHHASLNEASSLDALMSLVKYYPKSIAA
jgi:ankyrin repeat protein